jgi:clan AA aspartic protease (TIGR02281 family)
MKKEGSIYTLPCSVNGLKLRFIFDTGASNVCISLSEATFMLKNGYLDTDDIIGSSSSIIADGSLVENTRIILREIEIGGLKLYNVNAVVMHNIEAPLLLGQSAIQKLGTVQLQGDELIILNGKANLPSIKKPAGVYWYEIDNDDELKIEIDLISIKREDNYVTCYLKSTYVDENRRKKEADRQAEIDCKGELYEECIKIKQKWKDYQHCIGKCIYNCEENMYVLLSTTYYNKNGHVIDSYQFSERKWTDILPGTIGSNKLDRICTQYRIFYNGEFYQMYIEDAVLFLEQYPTAILQ